MLSGLARYLREYSDPTGRAKSVNATHFSRLLRAYTHAHVASSAANGSRPWVGENIEPDKGWWVARQIMYGLQPTSHGLQPPTDDRDRGVDYNHSTCADVALAWTDSYCLDCSPRPPPPSCRNPE